MQSSKDGSMNESCRGPREKNTDSGPPFQLFDSHCHLQDERFSGQVGPVLERSRKSRVTAMMCCGCNEHDWSRVHELIDRDGVAVSFGLHPWYVMQRTHAWFDRLRQLMDSVPGAGIGEIGLDNAIQGADRVAQEEVFVKQLRLAREQGRPVSIHCRKAFGRMIELLETEGGVEGGLVHSFSGSSELVPVFERLGLSLSFSGAITRPNNKRARAAVRAVSKSRLLIETDSPDLPPAGAAAGAVNEPANLPSVLETVATLIGVSLEETAKLTTDNARRLFGIQ
jgi:TatD DNase family protein